MNRPDFQFVMQQHSGVREVEGKREHEHKKYIHTDRIGVVRVRFVFALLHSQLLLAIPQWLIYIYTTILKHPCLFLSISSASSKNRLEAQITTISGGFKVSKCLPVLETMTPQHDETEG